MAKTKLTLTLDELHTPDVDAKVRQQAALATAQANSQRMAALPSPLPVPGSGGKTSIWYSTLLNMTLFGLLGGLMAWGCGELVHRLNPDQERAAQELARQNDTVIRKWNAGIYSDKQVKGILAVLDEEGAGNPYYTAAKLKPEERQNRLASLREQDGYKTLFADICFYSACGMMIAVCLGMAESVAARNFQSAIVYGAVGAALGLVGGFAVSLFADRLYRLVGGGNASSAVDVKQILARSLSWGVLGLFLSAAPGVIMRNLRKLLLGLLGGLIGGLIGGAMFDPVTHLALARFAIAADHADTLGRLVAITAIGVITGLATGLIENAAKSGWLKVVEGLIAGKQFILYRNPTFIGSAPQCEIYLFKDKRVGRRHAAMHIMEGGYDIEDLGTGGMTIVNGKAIARVRLKSNDTIRIGSTAFLFQEKDKGDHD